MEGRADVVLVERAAATQRTCCRGTRYFNHVDHRTNNSFPVSILQLGRPSRAIQHTGLRCLSRSSPCGRGQPRSFFICPSFYFVFTILYQTFLVEGKTVAVRKVVVWLEFAGCVPRKTKPAAQFVPAVHVCGAREVFPPPEGRLRISELRDVNRNRFAWR